MRDALKQRQQQERQGLADRHALQTADVQRRLRALDQIEQRERQSLTLAARKERRQSINARHAHMPTLAVTPAPAAESSTPSGSRHRQDSALAREIAAAAALLKQGRKKIRLADAFAQASGDEEGEDGTEGESGNLHPEAEDKRKKRPRRRRRLGHDFRQSASGDKDEGETGSGNIEAPKPAAEPSPGRRGGRKKRPARNSPRASSRGDNHDGDGKAEQDEARKKERQRRRRRRRDFDPGM